MIRPVSPARQVSVRAFATSAPSFTLSPLYASLLAGLTLAPLGAVAQSQTAEEMPMLEAVKVIDSTSTPNGRLNLDTPVETGSRLGLTPRETPASVTVVDRATIEARGAQDTQEILRAIPGVTAHNAPGSMSTGQYVSQLPWLHRELGNPALQRHHRALR
jgi:iron complex outermembrane receptor protein